MKKRIDWKAIELEFHAGKTSIRGIAITHRVSEGAIRKRAKVGGWWRQRTDCAPSAFALALSLQSLIDAASPESASSLRMQLDRLIHNFRSEIASAVQGQSN
jgi:hypothetical protein